jgi:hypothetical protein
MAASGPTNILDNVLFPSSPLHVLHLAFVPLVLVLASADVIAPPLTPAPLGRTRSLDLFPRLVWSQEWGLSLDQIWLGLVGLWRLSRPQPVHLVRTSPPTITMTQPTGVDLGIDPETPPPSELGVAREASSPVSSPSLTASHWYAPTLIPPPPLTVSRVVHLDCRCFLGFLAMP